MQRYRVQLYERLNGEMIIASGGVAQVVTAGGTLKVALTDKAGASQSNPIALTNGRIEFYTADSVSSVDLYVQAPGGQFAVAKGIQPGPDGELYIDTYQLHQCFVIPFNIADTTAAVETDTGFDEPTLGVMLPTGPAIQTTVVDATETIGVGTDSGDSGDADGFLAAVSVATAGLAQTLGVLLISTADKIDHISTAKSITFTLTAGTDTAEGFILLPYLLGNSS